MIRELTGGRREAASGETKSLVVFLHGYGADGNDLLGLAEPLAPHLPDTVFLAPNAPEKCLTNPIGYQWFPIPWLDGSAEEAATASMKQSAKDLDAFLDKAIENEGVTADDVILFGFSQGTMIGLHVAPRRSEQVAGVVGFSGRLLAPEQLKEQVVSKPPVLLIHGNQDEVVPFESLQEAGNALNTTGFEVYAHVMEGTGHGISPDGLSVALAFMREKLGVD
ncbi:alpha/beta hydrolase [Pseudoruegeria sp. HB172150]|uniref:alpha/beta hydrolase n=1 Tax=Pseudoruegeria sp. HB172150 TaxID=2721164 RepID=UPI0015558BAA|nr:dienelactone hydrolase family protein [Pseudoruegeria sp. HB172150]